MKTREREKEDRASKIKARERKKKWRKIEKCDNCWIG